MSFEHRGLSLDYHPVVYPGSPLRFRGPRQGNGAAYLLCLGGSETFGRFIHAPFPAQLRGCLPCEVVNMGVMNGGMDVIAQDHAIHAALQGAAAVVLQITGAANLSNRFYSVHPRRNDRFVKASTMLRTLYRDVDFTEFHFTRHLLTHLRALSRDRFCVVERELRAAWMARMTAFIDHAPVPVHLLWLARHPPDTGDTGARLGHDPLFVTKDMVQRVASGAASLTIAVPETTDTGGMFFAPREEAAARALPGPEAHHIAARLLAPVVTAALT
jgi:hypothetical protein